MVNKKELELKLKELQLWFEENSKLPEEIDPQLLKRFLKCMHYDVEETKKLIELNYMLRNKNPHLFLNRDPDDVNTEKSLVATDMVPLPGLTPEHNKILIYRLVDYDPSKMSSLEEAKIFFLTTDCLFTMEDGPTKTTANDDADDNDDDTAEWADHMAAGEVQIVDIAGYSMSHVARISFMTFRAYMKYLQEAYPVRLRAMHIINCPSFLDKMVAIMKPFISDEVYKMIHFHTGGLESLYKHVPRDMLPEEYGGKAGSMTDLKNEWRKILKEKRTYLMDPKQWKIAQTETRGRWLWW